MPYVMGHKEDIGVIRGAWANIGSPEGKHRSCVGGEGLIERLSKGVSEATKEAFEGLLKYF